MELRHLRYFVGVAEELNMRRASEKLHVSQPPLSRQIHDLEDELGAALFDRSNKRLRLTRAGEFFLKEAKEILSRSRRAAQLVQAVNRGEAGSLVIAYRVPISDMLPTRVLRRCREIFPSMELVIRELTIQEQIMALLESRIDLGYVGFKHQELQDILQFETIRRTEILVALPSGHRLVKKRRLALEELSDQSFVFVERSASPLAYDWLLGLAENSGFRPDVVQQADTAQNLFRLIAVGCGISLVPDILKCYSLPGVIFRPLKNRIQVDWSIAWRKDNKSPMLLTFLTLLREDIRKQAT
jgi:DNA-binding transcriptional LysR family regulator